MPSELAQQAIDIAVELWAEGKRMEKKGDAETDGIAAFKDDSGEIQRRMSRMSTCYGQAIAFERSAWKVLARAVSAFPDGIPDDFFEKNCPTIPQVEKAANDA